MSTRITRSGLTAVFFSVFLFHPGFHWPRERRQDDTTLGIMAVNHSAKPPKMHADTLNPSKEIWLFKMLKWAHILSHHPCLKKKNVSLPLSFLTAVKSQVTGSFLLNAKSEDAVSKTFIESGLEWEYSIDSEKETLKTTGPLHEGIVVLVSGTISRSLFFMLPLSLCKKNFFVYIFPGHSPRGRHKNQLDV